MKPITDFSSNHTFSIWVLIVLIQTSTFHCMVAQEFRPVEFKAFNLRPGNFTNLFYSDDKQDLSEIGFKQKSRTDTLFSRVSVKDNLLYFYSKNPSEPSLEANSILQVARVWVNPKWDSPLLLFLDQSNGKKQSYSIVAVKDSFQEFEIGSFKMVNMTGVDIIGMIDNEQVELANSTASDSFKINHTDKIRVIIAAESNARHHLLYKNTLSLTKNTRSLLILRPPKRTGSVKILGQLLIEYSEDEN